VRGIEIKDHIIIEVKSRWIT